MSILLSGIGALLLVATAAGIQPFHWLSDSLVAFVASMYVLAGIVLEGIARVVREGKR